jgi:hypothetical protein
MIYAVEALTTAQRTEYAAQGRADLDQRLVRLSQAERAAFWKAVRSAYTARPTGPPRPEESRAASPPRAVTPLLEEVC